MENAQALPEFDPGASADGDAPQRGLIPQAGGVALTTTQSRHMVLIDQVIDWMMLNPGARISKAAKVNGGPFDLSVIWLRQVTSADAFKARLAQKQQDIDTLLMVPTLKERLTAVTQEAVERLGEIVAVATDPELVKDATEMLLEQHYKLGVQPANGQQGSVNINVQMDSRTLTIVESRKRLLEGKVVPPATDGAVVQPTTSVQVENDNG